MKIGQSVMFFTVDCQKDWVKKKKKSWLYFLSRLSVTQLHSATKYASVEYVWATVQGSKLHVPLIADFF